MKFEDIPSEITVTLYPQVHMEYGWITYGDHLMKEHIQIADPIEITFATKTDNVREQVVESLREKASRIRAESERECMQIEDQIQRLLALSFDSGESA